MNLNLKRSRWRQIAFPRVSIPIRDLMNLNQDDPDYDEVDQAVSIPIRDLMNLNPLCSPAGLAYMPRVSIPIRDLMNLNHLIFPLPCDPCHAFQSLLGI